jgi:hypothetical protein
MLGGKDIINVHTAESGLNQSVLTVSISVMVVNRWPVGTYAKRYKPRLPLARASTMVARSTADDAMFICFTKGGYSVLAVVWH